jgi:hypothetical protein
VITTRQSLNHALSFDSKLILHGYCPVGFNCDGVSVHAVCGRTLLRAWIVMIARVKVRTCCEMMQQTRRLAQRLIEKGGLARRWSRRVLNINIELKRAVYDLALLSRYPACTRLMASVWRMRLSQCFDTEERQSKRNPSALRKRIPTIPRVFSSGVHSSAEADSETSPVTQLASSMKSDPSCCQFCRKSRPTIHSKLAGDRVGHGNEC